MPRKELGTIITRYLTLSKMVPPPEEWHNPDSLADARLILAEMDATWNQIESTAGLSLRPPESE
jgi:hypothetical protein